MTHGGGQIIPDGDGGEVSTQTLASGSGATGSAAREAMKFLELYEQYIGKLPDGRTVTELRGTQGFHDDIGQRGL